MIISGVGRLCVDVHLCTMGVAGRFDSTKVRASEMRSLGGSVPWILAHLAQAGHECRFVGPSGDERDWLEPRLEALGVRPFLAPVGITNSYIVYDPDFRIRRIIGVQENAAEFLPAGAVAEALPSHRCDWLVLDARHLAAAETAAAAARKTGAGVFLDPGSTVGLDNLVSSGRALLASTTVVCADTKGLATLTGICEPLSAAHALLDLGVEYIVHTGLCGEAELIGPQLHAKARQIEDITVGSTLGVGDAFKGWLLASLADCDMRPGARLAPDPAAHALQFGLAAAMARKADGRLLPTPFRRHEVEAFLPRTRVS